MSEQPFSQGLRGKDFLGALGSSFTSDFPNHSNIPPFDMAGIVILTKRKADQGKDIWGKG